jgi:hypothetical protein
MLSDKGSAVIRKFGILNANVPPDVTRFYGIPFPGQYLLAADGTVKGKVFLADYQERPTASQVLLTDFGTSVGNNSVVVQADGVTAKVMLSDTRSFSGQQLGLAIDSTSLRAGTSTAIRSPRSTRRPPSISTMTSFRRSRSPFPSRRW